MQMLIKFMTVSNAASAFIFIYLSIAVFWEKNSRIDINRWLFRFSFIHLLFDDCGNFLQSADPISGVGFKCWTGETQFSQCLQPRGFRKGGSLLQTRRAALQACGSNILYHTQMMILCHTPCHQPHSNPSITSVPLGSSFVFEGYGSPRPLVLPGCAFLERGVEASSRCHHPPESPYFLGLARMHARTQAHTYTHPEASTANVLTTHCALTDSRHGKCFQLVMLPHGHEETTRKQSTYYWKCILCEMPAGRWQLLSGTSNRCFFPC